MLTPQELEEVETYVLRRLPRVLEQDPDFVIFIEGIINEKFPRRDEFARLLDEFTSFRKETRENFEQVDQRFEQVDQHFKSIDQQFKEVKEQIGGVSQEMRDLRDWVETIAGGLQHRAGKNLENVVAGAFRLGLRRPEIQPEHVKLRQKISDPHGLVYKPGKEKEVDIIAYNDEFLVFEVKSAPDTEDVDDFADKVALVRLQHPEKQVEGVFVAVGAENAVCQRCAELGLLLIPEPKSPRK